MPLLIGLDGSKKMSKTSLNYIALNDNPQDMFGKVMSISDDMIYDYFALCAQISNSELESIKAKLEDREANNPRDLKALLGKRIVEIYHSKEAAENALKQFEEQFKQKKIPDDIPSLEITNEEDIDIVELISKETLAPSKSEARRLIKGGAVKINGEKISDPNFKLLKDAIQENNIIQVGKRKFLKLVLN